MLVSGRVNSHYFHIKGDKLINLFFVGVYSAIKRIPVIQGGMSFITQYKELIDPGTYVKRTYKGHNWKEPR